MDNRKDCYFGGNDAYGRVASSCSQFMGRGDVTMFNMVNYHACENCRHHNEHNHCGLGLDR